MAIKWTNKSELNRTFKQFEERYNEVAINAMLRLGEMVVKYAREDSSALKHFKDRTGNLRNSIGYIVVHNGRIIHTAFTGNTPSADGYQGDTAKARRTGLDYATDVANGLSKNKTYLVWVAGMEYAAAVEAKGYDVITGSGNYAESEAKKQVELFKRYLMRM